MAFLACTSFFRTQQVLIFLFLCARSFLRLNPDFTGRKLRVSLG